MSRVSNFVSWEMTEKRKLISQLIIDAVTNDSLSLAYALLGPCITQEEEKALARYQREVDENEQRMYPEEIRQRLFATQLTAINDYRISARYQDITIQGYVAAVVQASIRLRSELILAYRDRLTARLDIPSEEAGQRPELQIYIQTLDVIFKANPFELEKLDYLRAVEDSIKEKLTLAEKKHDAIAGQHNVSVSMQLAEMQNRLNEKRAAHHAAIQLAHGPTERSQWNLHDPDLKNMTFEEFESLANYNVEQTDAVLRVTVDNCVTVDGNSLLHLAFYNRSAEMAQFLIEKYGADLRQKNPMGQTAQDFANIERNDDPFLLLVLSRDGKRELSPFLQAVQEHLETYQRDTLESSFLYRLFHHLFLNIGVKHERRVNEHRQVRQAIQAAQRSYHDDDVVEVIRTLMATSPRRGGAFFKELERLLLARDGNRLASPHRAIRRIDSATAVQNTTLLDAYNRKQAECESLIAERNAIVDTLARERADRADEQERARLNKQGYDMSLQVRDETITKLSGENHQLVDKNTMLTTENTGLKQTIDQQNARIATLQSDFAELKEMFISFQKQQNQDVADQKKLGQVAFFS